MDALRYRRVWIADWSARSAAGGTAATWRAIAAGRSALVEEPSLGWVGRALPEGIPGRNRLRELAARCSHELSTPPQAADPLLAVSASKGDCSRLLDGLHPADLVAAMPGGLNPLVATHLGWKRYRECLPVAACSTGLYALLGAADALEHGASESAVAGAVDASLQPLLLAGFRRMGALCRGRPTALDGAGTGFAAAEGAGLFALSSRPGAWRVVAGIRLGDAQHPTRCQDPDVLRHALEALWATCPEPDAIVAHATGTAVGDRYETAGLDAGPWRRAERIAAKPVIGHCLGASAAVELAAALAGPHRRIWKLGLGFGGHLAGIALERT